MDGFGVDGDPIAYGALKGVDIRFALQGVAVQNGRQDVVVVLDVVEGSAVGHIGADQLDEFLAGSSHAHLPVFVHETRREDVPRDARQGHVLRRRRARVAETSDRLQQRLRGERGTLSLVRRIVGEIVAAGRLPLVDRAAVPETVADAVFVDHRQGAVDGTGAIKPLGVRRPVAVQVVGAEDGVGVVRAPVRPAPGRRLAVGGADIEIVGRRIVALLPVIIGIPERAFRVAGGIDERSEHLVDDLISRSLSACRFVGPETGIFRTTAG